MRLEKVQEALKTKKIHYEYTEENGCGSIDFMFRGLRFHIWEYEDRVWGAETNVFEAGRSEYAPRGMARLAPLSGGGLHRFHGAPFQECFRNG